MIQVTKESGSVGTTKSKEGGKVVKKIGLFLVSSSLLIVSAAVLCSFTNAQAGCQQQPIGALAGDGTWQWVPLFATGRRDGRTRGKRTDPGQRVHFLVHIYP